MLELLNISHSYGDRQVLQGVKLSLEAGQRIALMGPSGCGKTTLLKIALGLLHPSAGTVQNRFCRVAAVFQEPRLLPWCTAVENVNLVLDDRKNGLSRAMAALEKMELKDSAQKYPRELSGGMQQRVAIARALATEPDLLILDEPFKGMDESLRLRVLQSVAQTEAAVLRNLQSLRTNAILVTHRPEALEGLENIHPVSMGE